MKHDQDSGLAGKDLAVLTTEKGASETLDAVAGQWAWFQSFDETYTIIDKSTKRIVAERLDADDAKRIVNAVNTRTESHPAQLDALRAALEQIENQFHKGVMVHTRLPTCPGCIAHAALTDGQDANTASGTTE